MGLRGNIMELDSHSVARTGPSATTAGLVTLGREGIERILSHSNHAVVTGAFSFTGRYVARHLLDQGVGVRTLTRNPGRTDLFGGRVPSASLDFSDPKALRRSIEGAGVLYNTYWIRFGRGDLTPLSRRWQNSREAV